MNQQTNTLRNHAVFIGGATRSGTTLLLALLDGHPELVVFPEECNYFNYSDEGAQVYGILSSVFKEPLKGKSKALERMKGNSSSASSKGETVYSDFDFSEFHRSTEEFFVKFNNFSAFKIKRIQALLAMISAYNICSEKKEDMTWVVKTPNYERRWRDIFSDFPNAKLLCMVRNPLDVALSRTLKSQQNLFLKNHDMISQWSPSGVVGELSLKQIQEWEQSTDNLTDAQESYPSHILPIRYERLTQEPEAVMLEVASFLDITYVDALVKPTIRTRPWEGNSSFGTTFGGIEKRHKSLGIDLPDFRTWQVEAWLGAEKLQRWGYTPKSYPGNLNLMGLLRRIEKNEHFFSNRARMISNWLKDRKRDR